MFHLKGFRRGKASPVPSRHGKRAQSGAVQRPDLTALYAPEHPYLPTSIDLLRSRADWCRAEAADLDTQATDFISRAARLRIEAADFDRIAALAEQDIALPEPDPQAPAQPQMPPAGYFVHWLSGHDFWPACGEQGFGAKWATPHAAAVTCPTCQAASEADATGWNDPLPAPVAEPHYRHQAVPRGQSNEGMCVKCGADSADSWCSFPDGFPAAVDTAVFEAVDGGSR